MRLLINCSNLKIGGGIQVALSFIYESVKFIDNNYCVIAHEKVYNQIDTKEFPSNYKFIKYNYKVGRRSNNYLSQIEQWYLPDAVFSIFGPTYWTPKSFHLMGFARGHAIYKDSLYRKGLSFKNKILFDVKNKILMYYTKKNSDNFVVETELAQRVLSSLLPSDKKIYCVSNTYSAVYNMPSSWKTVTFPQKGGNEFWLVYICANYPHKNIQILPKVISHLKELDNKHKYKIVLSINENELPLYKEQKQHFIFLGKLNVNECPLVYKAADALLMPSLIEIFSASYLEAMKTECPILTSDLDFAHDICRDSAIYFNPLNPKDIAIKIKQLACDDNLKQKLVKQGLSRLRDFSSAEERAKQYLKICELLSHETNNTRP